MLRPVPHHPCPPPFACFQGRGAVSLWAGWWVALTHRKLIYRRTRALRRPTDDHAPVPRLHRQGDVIPGAVEIEGAVPYLARCDLRHQQLTWQSLAFQRTHKDNFESSTLGQNLRSDILTLWPFHTYEKGSTKKIRSSWLNSALRDDEAVYWVSIGHYEALAIGNWWYWVSRGHSGLYILQKVEIWTGVTDASLTDSLTHNFER